MSREAERVPSPPKQVGKGSFASEKITYPGSASIKSDIFEMLSSTTA